MAALHTRKYIPAGCLVIDRADCEGWDELLSSGFRNCWSSLSNPGGVLPELQPGLGHPGTQLSPEFQALLLHSTTLKPFHRLFQRNWIQYEFRIANDKDISRGICRVYVLPDDVDRRSTPRSDVKLRKDLQTLLSRLDYARETWRGECGVSRLPSPSRYGQDGAIDDGDASLLEMFNTIPSPNPQPGLVQDGLYQEVMDSLLMSKVDGLNTPLYAYQARSAALMLQREVQPGKVLDPRLVHVLDQEGDGWYYDDVSGTVLREPRLYDGISGGILAEEMGAGKTLICLSLILATRHFQAEMPDIRRSSSHKTRERVGSLVDMAAAAVTRESIPWSLPQYLGPSLSGRSEYSNCIQAIRRNPGCYLLPPPRARRQGRHLKADLPPDKIFLSNCSLVLVPANLVKQWEQEIRKHTPALQTLVVDSRRKWVPPLQILLTYDIMLFATTRFEKLKQDRTPTKNGWKLNSPLASIDFKRVIVDEGHKLGNSRMGKKSDLLLVLECLHVSARWIVTGTPSTGLYGVDDSAPATPVSGTSSSVDENNPPLSSRNITDSSGAQERKDLDRIGAIAAVFLKLRPWANTFHDAGDTPADWAVYVMQPRHSSRSSGRKDSLRATLNSLIIRHRRSEIGGLLPPVDEKVVLLEGSYQDKLCLNLFSTMIIFNAVQSQRADQDYFFHHRQRTALLLLVNNIRQSSFFGATFFSVATILKAVQTAEDFLKERKLPVREGDEGLLRGAIAFGQVAIKNRLKDLANRFHEVPLYVKDFPGGGGNFSQAWSLDGEVEDMVCTAAPLIRALQQFLQPCIDAPYSLTLMFNDGRFADKGKEEREKALEAREPISRQATGGNVSNRSTLKKTPALAGNAQLGENSVPIKLGSGSIGTPGRMDELPAPNEVPEREIAEPLAKAQIVSTASAKLSYLIDSIVRHQDDEQIIVFYENENVAFYLAEHLEIFQIHHLIYAKGITAERRAQYVDTFNYNPKFRVLLMDISQAAFGLDMRSASRIYFINPVLNPQVEAQAIGRVRRISQKKQVSVETLVLKDSLEEVIMDRREKMTQAEHRKCKSILDYKPIYDWILKAKIIPLPEGEVDGPGQMAPLKTPQFLFGRGFGRVEHPDEDLVLTDPAVNGDAMSSGAARMPTVNGAKRDYDSGPGDHTGGQVPSSSLMRIKPKRPKLRVQFAASAEEREIPQEG